MSIEELSTNLDKIISNYEHEAGVAGQYCDLATGDALSTSHKATAHALSSLKAEILSYLSQQ